MLEKMNCNKVYGEILNYDILGLHGNSNIIIEMKKNLSFKLLEQALFARSHGDYVYIATPARKRRYGIWSPESFVYKEFLKRYGIGWIEVNFDKSWGDPSVVILYKAKFNRIPKKLSKGAERQDIRAHIKDYSHLNIGGVAGGDRVTEYSQTIHRIKRYLRYELVYNKRDRQGWRTVDDILNECETHYASPIPFMNKND